MHPKLRFFLVAVGASVLGVWGAFSIAEESHFLATMTALLAVWAVLAWTRGPLAESWFMAFLIFGYVVGSRGFAQVTPVQGVPLFLGELGLLVGVSLLLLRGALTRQFPFEKDTLNFVLVAWLAVAAGRMPLDVRIYGVVALRDFATVYYAAYFFIAQALARHALSRSLLFSALTVTFAVLPFAAVLDAFVPEQIQTHLQLRGVPLIYYKDDLLASYLFASFIYFVPKREIALLRDRWRWLLSLLALAMGFIHLSRAGMVGLGAALVVLGLGRRWLPLKAVAVFGVLAVLFVALFSLAERRDFSQTKIYAIYEHVAAIADFEGTRQYRNADSMDSGDNNRFRLVWWRTVSQEVLTQSPVFGLGFGYDLARGFVAAYNPLMDDFSVRSPHSIVFTVLGRMGLLGLAAFATVVVVLSSNCLAMARLTRAGTIDDRTIALYAIAAVILVSACFGVVLEGPMGAIPFWLILGLTHRLTLTARTEANSAELPHAAGIPAGAGAA